MNWYNIKLILAREVRDQLRDRRTLFMIAILPVLLYPLLGMSLFQVTQFLREHPTRVLVIGGSELARREAAPQLFDKNGTRFSQSLFSSEAAGQLVEVTFVSQTEVLPDLGEDGALAETARSKMRQFKFDAVVYFPSDFVDRLDAFRGQLKHQGSKRIAPDSQDTTRAAPATSTPIETADKEKPKVPSPVIFYNTSREASQMAQVRLEAVMRRWTDKVGEQNLIDSEVPATAARPFSLESSDVAETGRRDASTWAKILPFVLVMWALTGAFYPAVDLCAGEKERGTLETLLCSPAQRSEIVVGKLLTVMLFSMATAILNLASMGFTGTMLFASIPQIGKVVQLGPPPISAAIWLTVALIPIAALFSALSVALAAFARSTKEGQYYLMPLILITMPLMLLPMSPSIELSLGTALIPVTGLMLLLRELVLGNYAFALMNAAPVVGVTLGGCYFAVRWAIDQFNSESVLFRESERLDLGLWLRHLRTDRHNTPTAAMAVLCGVLIIVIRFFAGIALPAPETMHELLVLQAITLVAFVAAPALIMASVLTRSPRETFSLRWPTWQAAFAVVVLAVVLNPLVIALHEVLQRLYPIDSRMFAGFNDLMASAPLGLVLLVFAVLPALCEELAFRGFILSGLREMGHPWRAILVSSVFFGVAHGILQQSISATLIGIIIGYIAIRSGSLLCCILFHIAHNGLVFILADATPKTFEDGSFWSFLYDQGEAGAHSYHPAIVVLAAVASLAAFAWFYRATGPKQVNHSEAAPPADLDYSPMATVATGSKR